MRGLTTPVFLLMALLIIVAYNAGFARSAGAAFSGISSLGNTFTGRTAAGQFAGYPGGFS
jgi:hypothetical protein